MKDLSLNYHFRNEQLMTLALTHRSASQNHNERLEYLGDALLGLIIAEDLFKRFPSADEGQLTRLRASVVNSDALFSVGQQFNIGNLVILGQGEKKTGGSKRVSIASNALEALVGAIYLDSDYATCAKVVGDLFHSLLTGLDPSAIEKDAKTTLQELLQGKGLHLPHYHVKSITGPPHDRVFEVSCSVKGLLKEPTLGIGESRRKGEQAAARQALSLIFEESSCD
jgi:ribonuclease-3